MKNLEKFGFPIAIGAAVIGIWAALRNKGGTTIAAAPGGSNIMFPSIPPLVQSLMQPGGTGASDESSPASHGMNTHHATVKKAAQNTGFTQTAAPQYIYGNIPPRLDLSKAVTAATIPAAPPATSSCGCQSPTAQGASSGGCKSYCDNRKPPMRFPDGAGGCMSATGKPKLPGLDLQSLGAIQFSISSAYNCNPFVDVTCQSGLPAD